MMDDQISIVYTANNDLVDVLSVSLASVLYNTKSKVNFYMLNAGINDANKNIIRQLAEKFDNFGDMTFTAVDLEKEFNSFPRFRGRFLDTYARILIPEVFSELDRCIYMDPDTIALWNIAELFNYDIGGFALGAVPDLWWNGYLYDKASPDNIKFSSGVLLIDCKKWRAEGITRKIIGVGLAHKDMIELSGLADMVIINFYFKANKFKALPGRYNFIGITSAGVTEMYGFTQYEIENEARNCVIRHFSGTKPWFSDHDQHFGTGRIRHFEEWWFFAALSPFCEAIKSKLLLNTHEIKINLPRETKIQDFNIQDFNIRLLKKILRRKYRYYRLLQFLTLGLVKKFSRRKKEYRSRYKQFII